MASADANPSQTTPTTTTPPTATTSPTGSAAGLARPGLRRGLKVLGTLLITLSAVTPASSVFIIAPGVITQAGTGAFLSFLVAGVVGVFMAFVYAELASAYPLSGGEYAVVARTVGRLPGFITLGLILITQLLIIAVIALGVGTYLAVLFPNLNGQVVGAITCLAATALATLDIKLNSWVTGAFLAVELIALAVVSGLGLVHPARSIGDLVTHPVVAGSSGALVPASIGLIGAATAVAIFSYNGYGSAVYFGEETKNAHRGIARAILWALVITVVAELLPVTAVLLGSPSLGDLFKADNIMSYFITARGGSWLNTAVSLAVALAILNAVLAIILITARMVFSTGRDAAWPSLASRALATIHPRFGTPWVATVVVGVIGTGFCFVPQRFLLVVTGTTIVVVYAALCIGVLAGRRNGSTAHAAYRMPWFPVAPILALVALGYVVYENALDPEVGRPSLYVTVGIGVASAAYYLFVVRRRGTWELRGADDE